MPRALVRPRSDQEKASRARPGIPVRPARPLPGGTPEHIWERLHEGLQGSRERLDEIARALRSSGSGPPVLETATVTIGASGVFTQDRYRVPFASVAVYNSGSSPITVAAGTAQGAAPGGGQGMFIVPAYGFRSVNLAGSALSVYGAPGTVLDYTVMTARIQPAASTGLAALGLVAATSAAGVPLINGTQTILSWDVPDDGQLHQFNVAGALQVTAAETGGTVIVSFTQPGGAAATPQIFAASLGAGTTGATENRLAAPGSTVSVTQSQPLTAGASVLYAQIMAL